LAKNKIASRSRAYQQVTTADTDSEHKGPKIDIGSSLGAPTLRGGFMPLIHEFAEPKRGKKTMFKKLENNTFL